ncbi:hypothetical protein Krac_4922 [Ktedonobacter racemifer DSM 44963]|uniref:Uncharacterized protein n=1 Tax=Ktedonobacter racemifer DSM 44963 TaxID=485913 RepID=D6TU17_KTERA|nr:hypothetical protein Krac_4922 [Ktedonobacter racemifer DSM 44963]
MIAQLKAVHGMNYCVEVSHRLTEMPPKEGQH